MKKSLPAPPQPSFITKPSSFNDGTPRSIRASSHNASTRAGAEREAAARRDEGFLGRTFSSALWLGALMAMSAAMVFGSGGVGLSVGVGVALSLALLKSQELVVQRATRRLADAKVRREYSQMTLNAKLVACAPLLLVGTLKYGVAGALMALAFKQNWFSTMGFVCGFTLLQVVLLARVTGALLAARVRPVREVYTRKNPQVSPSNYGI